MSDPYAWIDPFEEVEKAKAHALRERDAGRHEVLDAIADENDGDYHRALHNEILRIAHETAEQYVGPDLRKAASSVFDRMRLEDAALRLYSLVPAARLVEAQTLLGLRSDTLAPEPFVGFSAVAETRHVVAQDEINRHLSALTDLMRMK